MNDRREPKPGPSLLDYAGPRPVDGEKARVSKLAVAAFACSLVACPCISTPLAALLVREDIIPLSAITIALAVVSLCLSIVYYLRLMHAPERITGNGLVSSSIGISGAWLMLDAWLLWYYGKF